MNQHVEQLRLRPLARLLTMLGEQLIKNDRIAIVELVKNSYDADATKVSIYFEDFGPELETLENSRIVIVDNGDGMTVSTMRDHWLNPATDVKSRLKQGGRPRTVGGRVIQGEKGIGRFAMFKLGSSVELITRSRESEFEVKANLDLQFLDDSNEDLDTDLRASVQYLDEIEVDVVQQEPGNFPGSYSGDDHGTWLAISNLRSPWSFSILKGLHEDLLRLRPLNRLLTGPAGEDQLGFDIEYIVNGEVVGYLEDPTSLLESVIPRAVLRVVGSFNENRNAFVLNVNDQDREVSLNSEDIRGLELYKRYVAKDRSFHQFRCGDFAFEFLVFDLRPTADAEHSLDPNERKLVRERRIYLYRDGVRVLPYGDPDDDWLQLDAIRGTQGANRLLSNDQTVGFVYISQSVNPKLRDKTNREGLIDSGEAYQDFIRLLQLLVNYLRKADFQIYLTDSRRRVDFVDEQKARFVDARIQEMRGTLLKIPKARRAFDEFATAFEAERRLMLERVERTEYLAGVGLSIETASHDVVASANQAHRDVLVLHDRLVKQFGDDGELTKRAASIKQAISFVVSRLQDVQGLFVSARRRPKTLEVVEYVKKIQSIYSHALEVGGIQMIFEGDEQFEVKSHEATLLQVFLNLIDNSIYWIDVTKESKPQITIQVNSTEKTILISDNGPGIDESDVPYIFEPFFSAKGDEGRGLGLYIARQVARRDGIDLELVAGKRLTGSNRVPATFRVQFN